MKKGIRTIDYDTRRIILDKYISGMTIEALADVYKVPRGIISSIVHSRLTKMIGL